MSLDIEHNIHSSPDDIDALHELRPEELILMSVRLRAKRRIAWLRKIWTEAAAMHSAGENPVPAHAAIDIHLYNMDIPEAEANWYASNEAMQSLNATLQETENVLGVHDQCRMAQLCRLFQLNAQEVDVLHACIAITLEPGLGRVYAYLQDHSGHSFVTQELVARLFEHGRYLQLGSQSPLIAWRLILETPGDHGEVTRLSLDPFIRKWLLGVNDADESLSTFATKQAVHEPLPGWPTEEMAADIEKIFSKGLATHLRYFIAGAEGSGRRSFAAIISYRLAMPLVTIDCDRVSDVQWPHIFMLAQRMAFLRNNALAWKGASLYNRYWPNIHGAKLQFVIGETDETIPAAEGLVDKRIEIPKLSHEQCRQLWLRYIPASLQWDPEELDDMLRRHRACIGHITSIASNDVTTIEGAAESLRLFSRQRLGELAQHMSTAFTMKDLVVSPSLHKSLEDFIFEAKDRLLLWERANVQRLFPYGKGLLALFTGSSGTGKTMAAQVIANNLKLDLFRIDLSAVVSKYVGETSKNLECILSRAMQMDVVLLFDEADALFGKRTEIKDAHDRFANTDTNYLLQAIEQYPGVAILASNRKANIDIGFTRRLRYVLDFQKPDAAHRLKLWTQLLEELTSAETAVQEQHNLKLLADKLEITGAQIKFSILSAIFIARKEGEQISVKHLLQGLERELMKDGRGVGREIRELFKSKAVT